MKYLHPPAIALLLALAASSAGLRARGQEPVPKPPASQAYPTAKPFSVAQPRAVAQPRTVAKSKAVTLPAATLPALPAPAALPTPTPGLMNRLLIVLDPAHGGLDSGSRVGESILEKNVTLSLAFRLRSLLTARGFAVVMTREADTANGPNAAGQPMTLDDRAGIANHPRPVACLLLHATGSGTGVHLYTSELAPLPGENANLPWLTAQAAWVTQSQGLARQIATALTHASVPHILSSASVRPVDSLTCPALVVEIAPSSADDPSTVQDLDYQQRVASAIAGALLFWKDQAQPPLRMPAALTGSLRANGARP